MMKKARTNTYPECHHHANCFARKDVQCTCLTDTDFGGRECPFYKPKSRDVYTELPRTG